MISASPKSDSIGRAYAAAVEDVVTHGALPVPNHLRNAADRRMKHHGIGVGYRNPHEFPDHDVPQQYLPDALKDRRYYFPTDQGQEASIRDRLERRRAAREVDPNPRPARREGPAGDMSAFGRAMKTRSDATRRIADTEKRDAEG